MARRSNREPLNLSEKATNREGFAPTAQEANFFNLKSPGGGTEAFCISHSNNWSGKLYITESSAIHLNASLFFWPLDYGPGHNLISSLERQLGTERWGGLLAAQLICSTCSRRLRADEKKFEMFATRGKKEKKIRVLSHRFIISVPRTNIWPGYNLERRQASLVKGLLSRKMKQMCVSWAASIFHCSNKFALMTW